jgi:hypothetical protein
VIRQAISCDICATEKRQTNHWFVAYEQGGELRVSGWTSRHRLRPDSKHLCGQTCLHKLVDEFVAKSNAARALRVEDEPEAEPRTDSRPPVDASLTSSAAFETLDSSARLLIVPAPVPPRPSPQPQPEPVILPSNPEVEALPDVPAEPPRYASRSWRTEAWERERERELRAAENNPGIAAHRRRSNPLTKLRTGS